MSNDTDTSAAGDLRRPRKRQRRFALGAAFLFFGLMLGTTTALAATGVAALLARGASAAEPSHRAASFPPAAALPRTADHPEPSALFEIGDEPAASASSSADAGVPRTQRSKSRNAGAALTLRRATAETSTTLGALLAADARAHATKR